MTRERYTQKGFSLIEMMVAFAIVSISLGLIYRSIGSSVRTVSDMAMRQQAALLAKSLLSLHDDAPAEGIAQSGQNGVFNWSITSTIYPQKKSDVIVSNVSNVSNNSVANLHEISILIEWSRGGKTEQWGFSTLLPQRATSQSGTK